MQWLIGPSYILAVKLPFMLSDFIFASHINQVSTDPILLNSNKDTDLKSYFILFALKFFERSRKCDIALLYRQHCTNSLSELEMTSNLFRIAASCKIVE